MAKKKPEESDSIAEGTLRELGLGDLVDLALKSPAFQERFKEVNKEIEERISRGATGEKIHPSTRLGIRPHVESDYSIRYAREETGKKWEPIARKPIRKPIKKIVAEEPEEIEPLVDVFDEGDYLRVIAELPGVEENNIKLEAAECTLKISAESRDRKYSKEVELPAKVTGEPKSSYRNGVLEVKLRKAK